MAKVKFRYTYKSYPFSKKLNKISKYIGYYTNFKTALSLSFMCILFSSLYIKEHTGLAFMDYGLPAFIILCIPVYIILRMIRKYAYHKMDQLHQDEILRLQKEEPAVFIQICQQLQAEKERSEQKLVPPVFEDGWICNSCGTSNHKNSTVCYNCNVSRNYSDQSQ